MSLTDDLANVVDSMSETDINPEEFEIIEDIEEMEDIKQDNNSVYLLINGKAHNHVMGTKPTIDILEYCLAELKKFKELSIDKYGNNTMRQRNHYILTNQILVNNGLLIQISKQKYIIPKVEITVQVATGETYYNPSEYLSTYNPFGDEE